MEYAPQNRVSIGSLVTNLKMEAWGPGKILELSGTVGTVHFRDLPTGSQVRKIGLPYLTLAQQQTDPALDLVDLPRSKGAAAKRKRAAPRPKKAVAKKPEPTPEPVDSTD